MSVIDHAETCPLSARPTFLYIPLSFSKDPQMELTDDEPKRTDRVVSESGEPKRTDRVVSELGEPKRTDRVVSELGDKEVMHTGVHTVGLYTQRCV